MRLKTQKKKRMKLHPDSCPEDNKEYPKSFDDNDKDQSKKDSKNKGTAEDDNKSYGVEVGPEDKALTYEPDGN